MHLQAVHYLTMLHIDPIRQFLACIEQSKQSTIVAAVWCFIDALHCALAGLLWFLLERKAASTKVCDLVVMLGLREIPYS